MTFDSVIKPLLLVNTIGTITPVKLPSPSVEWGAAHIWDTRVPIHIKLRRWIIDISEEYDLVWCTDWSEDGVRDLESNLGFGGFRPCIIAPDQERPEAAKQWLKDTGNDKANLVWMDHSLPDNVMEWGRARTGRTMIIRPDPMLGITQEHVSLLELYAVSPDLVRSDAGLSLWTP